ncbi:MAG: PilZ domain-containing protein [Bdellovibrionales bacterium]|nr:PilZ domain-containing protein [Bdellovibrionales bacterium]
MENIVEKRRAIRKSEDSLVRFEGDDFLIYSRMLDISDHGAFVATHYLLDPGTDINLVLTKPSGKEEPKAATVVHSNASKNKEGKKVLGLGIEFKIKDQE